MVFENLIGGWRGVTVTDEGPDPEAGAHKLSIVVV